MTPSYLQQNGHREPAYQNRVAPKSLDTVLENYPVTVLAILGTESNAEVGWGFRHNVRQWVGDWVEHRQLAMVRARWHAEMLLDEKYPHRLPCPVAA